MNNVSNAKYDKTSIWFVTLAISIADNWALDTIKIRLPRLIIVPYRSNFATIFGHFISQLKKLAVVERLLGNLRWRRFRGDGDRPGRESLELRQPSLPVKNRTLRSQWTQKDGAFN